MNLQDILNCFENPLKEDQVWALCYKCASKLQSRNTCVKDIINVEGYVSPNGLKSVIIDHHGQVEIEGINVESESEVVLNLGLLLFAGLDYGLDAEEEQQISEPLEKLLSIMTCNAISDQENCDEGYNDDKSMEPCSLSTIVQICKSSFSNSDDDYSEICHSMLKEAYLLKSFLSNISAASEGLHRLNRKTRRPSMNKANSMEKQHFECWTHYWMDVLSDLSSSQPTLRHVDSPRRPSINSYELSPYELLMEDIKKRKYSLRQVETTYQSPSKTNPSVHDAILEYVKSQPTLMPAHKRVLGPLPPRSKSVHEKLIEQIKDNSLSLRPVSNKENMMRCSRSFTTPGKMEESFTPCKIRGKAIRYSDSIRRNQLLPSGLYSNKSWVYDDAVFAPKETRPLRRTQSAAIRSTSKKSLIGNRSQHLSRLTESVGSHSVANLKDLDGRERCATDGKVWKMTPNDCLSLTVEEVMHIRQVLTRADLEKIQQSKELYQALKNGKICFCCKLRKFSIFTWSHACQICKQKVCGKCLKRLETPAQKYLKIPVYALSPASLTSNLPSTGSVSRPSFSMMFGSPFYRLSPTQQESFRQTYRKQPNSTLYHNFKMDVCVECYLLITAILEINGSSP